MTANAKLLLNNLTYGEAGGDNEISVAAAARKMGWGWHRTNNALKELGIK